LDQKSRRGNSVTAIMTFPAYNKDLGIGISPQHFAGFKRYCLASVPHEIYFRDSA
jgi:hypothetical protein